MIVSNRNLQGLMSTLGYEDSMQRDAVGDGTPAASLCMESSESSPGAHLFMASEEKSSSYPRRLEQEFERNGSPDSAEEEDSCALPAELDEQYLSLLAGGDNILAPQTLYDLRKLARAVVVAQAEGQGGIQELLGGVSAAVFEDEEWCSDCDEDAELRELADAMVDSGELDAAGEMDGVDAAGEMDGEVHGGAPAGENMEDAEEEGRSSASEFARDSDSDASAASEEHDDSDYSSNEENSDSEGGGRDSSIRILEKIDAFVGGGGNDEKKTTGGTLVEMEDDAGVEERRAVDEDDFAMIDHADFEEALDALPAPPPSNTDLPSLLIFLLAHARHLPRAQPVFDKLHQSGCYSLSDLELLLAAVVEEVSPQPLGVLTATTGEGADVPAGDLGTSPLSPHSAKQAIDPERLLKMEITNLVHEARAFAESEQGRVTMLELLVADML